jgi:hypothetical protein
LPIPFRLSEASSASATPFTSATSRSFPFPPTAPRFYRHRILTIDLLAISCATIQANLHTFPHSQRGQSIYNSCAPDLMIRILITIICESGSIPCVNCRSDVVKYQPATRWPNFSTCGRFCLRGIVHYFNSSLDVLAENNSGLCLRRVEPLNRCRKSRIVF